MVVRTSSRAFVPFADWEGWLGPSEMATLVRTYDWTQTPLGPIEMWPQNLKSAVAICLGSPVQMAILWGPELSCIYNDAKRDVLGPLHPGALGLPAQELLGDSWAVVGPQLHAVMEQGKGILVEDQPLTFSLCGGPAASYSSCSYSPIPDDDDGVGGVLVLTLSARADPDSALRALELDTDECQKRELQALLDDLRAAQRRVAAAGDAERRRVERDLHDGAQQRLMAIRLELGLVRELLDHDPRAAGQRLDELHHELDATVEQLRELAHGLYPPLLASDGLYAALESVARHSSMPVTVDGDGMNRAPRPIESAAYFCCLEALQNATKHAGPDANVSIHVHMSEDALRFRVSDDGVGFDPEAVRPGYGLINLRDRIDALGGRVEVTSAPGQGTTVQGRIPLH
jgi:signal transduction histidine kinase